MEVSVVIATFNRRDTLNKAMKAHLAQSALNQLAEILIVDDGSSDGTAEQVATLARHSSIPIRYWYQPKRGAAAARNMGIREAKGEVILFVDDDIIPAPDLVGEHLKWHGKHPDLCDAVLGHITWSPEVHPTPFMRWISLDGVLTAYRHIALKTEVDFRYFYTGNLSLKTEFLRRTGNFDEDFGGYGFEDTELGYRLQKNGMRLFYNPAAVAYHYKRVTFAEACRRAQQVELARSILDRKEAGKHMRELEAMERSAVPQRGRLGRLLLAVLVALLSPLKLLIDSPIPLPWRLYRRFYNDAVAGMREPTGSS
jgi:GT2 family glycosyltransferase